jgi:dTDP-4-dehydrorhamnose reductase
MMKVLITGTNGFLGNHLLSYLAKFDFQLYSITRSALINHQKVEVQSFIGDVTNKMFIEEVIQNIKPNAIVHCAAMSKPDDCENNKELCWKTNVLSTQHLIEASLAFNSHVVFCSTDFVYGEGENHTEEDACNPLNYYAQSKLAAEKIVKKATKNYTIIRPVFMYGHEIVGVRKSFVQWVKESLEQNKNIKVVNDQFRTPTYVVDVCSAIQTILSNNKTGTYNIAGSEILTPYQMAIILAKQLNLDENLIKPVTENDFKEPVQRAKRSIANIDKAKLNLGFNPIDFSKFNFYS